MKIPRRSFLSALLAPVVARFLPKSKLAFKPRSLGMTSYIRNLPPAPDIIAGNVRFDGGSVHIVTFFDRDGSIFEDRGEGPVQISNLYHHGLSPIVPLLSDKWPWEKPSNG